MRINELTHTNDRAIKMVQELAFELTAAQNYTIRGTYRYNSDRTVT